MKTMNKKALVLAGLMLSSSVAQANMFSAGWNSVKGSAEGAWNWTSACWNTAVNSIKADLTQPGAGMGTKLTSLAKNKYFWLGAATVAVATYGSYKLVKKLSAKKITRNL